jgi:hypothetical protein
MPDDLNRNPIETLQASLDALGDTLERTTGSAERMVEETERYWRVQVRCSERKRLASLAARIRALRRSIELRTRTLRHLRARMLQLRGGSRPH